MTPSDDRPTHTIRTIHTIRELIDHLKGQGVDTDRMQLVAHVKHLHAGERDHYSGQRVQVFHPVATQLDFVLRNGTEDKSGPATPIVTVTYSGDTVSKKNEHQLDTDAFNGRVQVQSTTAMPVGVEVVAGELMRSLVDKHREITGHVSGAFEKIEVKPGMIESIKRERFDLKIGLERLAKYIELDAEWRHTLFANMVAKKRGETPSSNLDDLAFEKLMLTERFLKNPCPKKLYMDLRREFAAQGSHAMDFIDYYEWFKGSEAKLDANGELNAETRAGMEKAIKAWHATGGDREDFKQETLSWASRNFEIHPRHNQVVAEFIDEVVGQMTKKPQSLRSEANKNSHIST